MSESNTTNELAGFAFVSGYAPQGEAGIHVFHYDAARRALTSAGSFAGLPNPSFLALHPTRPIVYAVNEVEDYDGKKQGAVSALRFDPATAELTFLGAQPTLGGAPCNVTVDRSGRFLFVANYSGGSVAMYPVLPDGGVGAMSDFVQHAGSSVHPERQSKPYAHQVMLDPTNRRLYVCDLGMDKLLIYGLDFDAGRLRPLGAVRTHPGAGPRHMRFHPNGRVAYVINELDNTISVLAVDRDGGMRELQVITTLPAGYVETSYCADIHITHDGRFVYGSNRGHESIAAFAVDADSGTLTALGQAPTGGKWPRNFALLPDESHLIVANQHTNDLFLLPRNAERGTLGKATGRIEASRPVCVVFGAW
jgi:6-phosphogluconolactonase